MSLLSYPQYLLHIFFTVCFYSGETIVILYLTELFGTWILQGVVACWGVFITEIRLTFGNTDHRPDSILNFLCYLTLHFMPIVLYNPVLKMTRLSSFILQLSALFCVRHQVRQWLSNIDQSKSCAYRIYHPLGKIDNKNQIISYKIWYYEKCKWGNSY